MSYKKFNLSDVVIPLWLKEVNPNSTLSVKDIAQLFGVSEGFIHALMVEGRLPRPEIDTHYSFERPATLMMGNQAKHSKKLQWRVGKMIKLINDAKEKVK